MVGMMYNFLTWEDYERHFNTLKHTWWETRNIFVSVPRCIKLFDLAPGN